mmetsp:Transcript_20821/g.32208  ORF Transcript_20821/g.32208 Transcript_20821/m.32208 type:complete len:99 (+) Transcript_20821:192-488(+)
MFDDTCTEGGIKGRVPIIVAVVDAWIMSDSANLEFLHGGIGKGMAPGMVRMEEDGGVLSSREEDDFSSRMMLGKFCDIKYLIIYKSPCIKRTIMLPKL